MLVPTETIGVDQLQHFYLTQIGRLTALHRDDFTMFIARQLCKLLPDVRVWHFQINTIKLWQLSEKLTPLVPYTGRFRQVGFIELIDIGHVATAQMRRL